MGHPALKLTPEPEPDPRRPEPLTPRHMARETAALAAFVCGTTTTYAQLQSIELRPHWYTLDLVPEIPWFPIKPKPATVRRWAMEGMNGIGLRCGNVEGELVTCDQFVYEFLMELADPDRMQNVRADRRHMSLMLGNEL